MISFKEAQPLETQCPCGEGRFTYIRSKSETNGKCQIFFSRIYTSLKAEPEAGSSGHLPMCTADGTAELLNYFIP